MRNWQGEGYLLMLCVSVLFKSIFNIIKKKTNDMRKEMKKEKKSLVE